MARTHATIMSDEAEALAGLGRVVQLIAQDLIEEGRADDQARDRAFWLTDEIVRRADRQLFHTDTVAEIYASACSLSFDGRQIEMDFEGKGDRLPEDIFF